MYFPADCYTVVMVTYYNTICKVFFFFFLVAVLFTLFLLQNIRILLIVLSL